jgi:hypothetical protein
MPKPSPTFLDSFWSYFHPGYKEKNSKGINSIADLSKVFSSGKHLKGINGKDVLQLKSYFDEELSINEELRKLFSGMTRPDDQGKENKIISSINDQINRNAILTKKLNVNHVENIWIKQQLKANEKLNKKLLVMLKSRLGSGWKEKGRGSGKGKGGGSGKDNADEKMRTSLVIKTKTDEGIYQRLQRMMRQMDRLKEIRSREIQGQNKFVTDMKKREGILRKMRKGGGSGPVGVGGAWVVTVKGMGKGLGKKVRHEKSKVQGLAKNLHGKIDQQKKKEAKLKKQIAKQRQQTLDLAAREKRKLRIQQKLEERKLVKQARRAYKALKHKAKKVYYTITQKAKSASNQSSNPSTAFTLTPVAA